MRRVIKNKKEDSRFIKNKKGNEKFFIKNKKGDEILTENIVFIILNISFFAILIGFIYLQGSSVHLKEQEVAKQIALLIDVAKPGTEISLNLKDFFEKAEKEGINPRDSIIINNEKNIVRVIGSKGSYFEYSFFNDLDVESNFNGNYWILKINKKVDNSKEVEK